MDLRDYTWNIPGDTQVSDELTLRDIHFEVNTIIYRAKDKEADLELLYWEGNGLYRHSRVLTAPISSTDEKITNAIIVAFIENRYKNAVRV